MKKMLLAVAAIMMSVMVGAVVPVGSVSAEGEGSDCGSSLLGLRPWYEGLEMEAGCSIKAPENEEALSPFIWKIVTNILYDMFVVVGYLAVGFIIYGGVTYILARGDPGKVERGKKTIIGAVSGLVIALVASFVVAFIADNIIG